MRRGRMDDLIDRDQGHALPHHIGGLALLVAPQARPGCLPGPHIIAQEQSLVADVQQTVGYHRMCPGRLF